MGVDNTRTHERQDGTAADGADGDADRAAADGADGDGSDGAAGEEAGPVRPVGIQSMEMAKTVELFSVIVCKLSRGLFVAYVMEIFAQPDSLAVRCRWDDGDGDSRQILAGTE